MNSPQISIVVPVYNVESVIARCIESITYQTFRDWELLLIDDGSFDNSGIICDEYARIDSRIKVIHKPNGGVSSARNMGIEMSKGEWICFIDSDDTIDHTYLADFSIESDKYDLYLQGYKRVVSGQIESEYSFKDLKQENLSSILAFTEDYRIINSPCYKLYKSSIIRKYNITFEVKTSYGEDHLFSLEYIKYVSKVKYSLACGYNYVISQGESLSHRIIPLDDIVYYTVTSRKKHVMLYEINHSKLYLSAINRRLLNNIVKISVENILAKRTFIDFSNSYHQIKPLIHFNSLSGLALSRKLFLALYYVLPVRLIYILLKSQYGKNS